MVIETSSMKDTSMLASIPAASSQHAKYHRLIASAKAFEPVTTAVAHPCDRSSLEAVIDAANMGLIRPILVGPKARPMH